MRNFSGVLSHPMGFPLDSHSHGQAGGLHFDVFDTPFYFYSF